MCSGFWGSKTNSVPLSIRDWLFEDCYVLGFWKLSLFRYNFLLIPKKLFESSFASFDSERVDFSRGPNNVWWERVVDVNIITCIFAIFDLWGGNHLSGIHILIYITIKMEWKEKVYLRIYHHLGRFQTLSFL